jgi:hypothetical protein
VQLRFHYKMFANFHQSITIIVNKSIIINIYILNFNTLIENFSFSLYMILD